MLHNVSIIQVDLNRDYKTRMHNGLCLHILKYSIHTVFPHVMTMKNLLTSQNPESFSTESIIIELANEGYGFGFSLASGEDGDSVIKYLIPDGIAERVNTKV